MTPDNVLAATSPWRADGNLVYALTGGADRSADALMGGMETAEAATYVVMLHNQRVASMAATATMNPALTDITIEQR